MNNLEEEEKNAAYFLSLFQNSKLPRKRKRTEDSDDLKRLAKRRKLWFPFSINTNISNSKGMKYLERLDMAEKNFQKVYEENGIFPYEYDPDYHFGSSPVNNSQVQTFFDSILASQVKAYRKELNERSQKERSTFKMEEVPFSSFEEFFAKQIDRISWKETLDSFRKSIKGSYINNDEVDLTILPPNENENEKKEEEQKKGETAFTTTEKTKEQQTLIMRENFIDFQRKNDLMVRNKNTKNCCMHVYTCHLIEQMKSKEIHVFFSQVLNGIIISSVSTLGGSPHPKVSVSA